METETVQTKKSFTERFKAALARPKRVKTPTVLQMEAVECGAASLAMIVGYHGSYYPLEELRVSCGVSRDGSKASNILKAARRYGFESKGYRKDPDGVREQIELPAIVHWNFNHFVVLEGFHKDKVYLNDPGVGPRTVTATEFDESFTGVVLTFKKGADYVAQGKKPSLLKALYERVKGNELALAFVVFISLALIVPGLLIPVFSRVFVDSYLVNGQTQWMTPLIIGLLLTAIARMGLTWLQQRYLLRLENKLSIVNSSRLMWHILRLPIAFFVQRSAGDISSRIGQNDRVAQLLSGRTTTTFLNVILIGFYGLLMWRYSPQLTLIAVAMAALNFVMLRYVSRKRKDINQRLVKDRGMLRAVTFGSLQQVETIKSSGAENDAFSRWAGYHAKSVNASQALATTNIVLQAMPPFLSQVTALLILCIGGLLIIDGQMSVGMLVAFQSLMISFLSPIGQMVSLGSELQEMEGIIGRLNDVLNYEPDSQTSLSPANDSDLFKKLTGRLTIRDLSFGYSRLSPPIIDDFNLELEPGMRVALVGGSGSGKSTVARLVAGLYAPWHGQILFDGHPRERIPRHILNNSLRTVDQEIFLFDGTIRDNLTMWDHHIPEEDIVRAAKDAFIHQEVMDRTGGFDFEVQEGGRNFSGGQRQRLELARALVSNPSIIILDEATSALDPVTESMIDDALRRRGCTCLIVAHRLSTIRDCDEIIVLEHGKIVERGSHETLWRQGGVYTRLIKSETPESDLVLDSILEALPHDY